MSNVRALNKSAKPGPGRPRTRPIDPNWNDLKAIESEIFATIPADADLDKLNDKISAVREARATDDPKQYAIALRDLIAFHQDSFKADESYSIKELDSLLRADEVLQSDSRAIALARGILHIGSRDGKSPKTLDQLLEEAKQKFRSDRADVRPHLQALGGDWDTKGAIDLAKDMQSEFEAEFVRQGAHTGEATFRAKRRTAQVLTDMATDPKKSYIVLSSTQENASIKLFMDPKSSTMKPVVDADEVVKIRSGITAARTNRFNREPINVNVMANDSTSAMPSSISSQLEDGDLAFTYFGGDGVFIYPEKVNKMLSEGVDSNWFSTEIKDSQDLYKHLIVHETGHLQMYKLWGEGKGSGRGALEKDFTKYKVSKDGTSDYGNESISESFAEQYAKYLITGNASPEFLELLASKGLTKLQMNKKWRDNVTSQFVQSDFHSNFFKFIEGIHSDMQNGGTPEYVGAQASLYGRENEYGTHNSNIVARIMGFRQNKPETVAKIVDDEQVVYRGVDADKGRTGWQLHNEFRTKDFPWFGFGVYGNGQYSSKSRSEAAGYGSAVAKLRVKDDAKIYIDRGTSEFGFDKKVKNRGLDLQQLHTDLFKRDGILEQVVINEINPDLDPDDAQDYKEIRSEVQKLARAMGLSTRYEDDRTIFAAMLGFQGVEVRGNIGVSYAIILDRSMMQMEVLPGFGA